MNLHYLDSLDKDTDTDRIADTSEVESQSQVKESLVTGTLSKSLLVGKAATTRKKHFLSKIWIMFEEPNSSCFSKIIGCLSIFFIVASVATFCLETVSHFDKKETAEHTILQFVEMTCIGWFTLEFAARFVACPNKSAFVKNFMNWIDLCAIVPYLLVLTLRSQFDTISVLRAASLVRVFRIFKLSRHSYGLQILGHTLKSSCRELLLVVFFLSIGVVIFSSLAFYAEKDANRDRFSSIPAAFWWSVVTMTTVGYGDIVPITTSGKVVGVLCALCGLLVISLPVPVVVSNFSLYYSQVQAQLQLHNRRKKNPDATRSKSHLLHPWFRAQLNRSSFNRSVVSGSWPQGNEAWSSPQSNRLPVRVENFQNPHLLSPLATLPNTPQSPSAAFSYRRKSQSIGASSNISWKPFAKVPVIVTNASSPTCRSVIEDQEEFCTARESERNNPPTDAAGLQPQFSIQQEKDVVITSRKNSSKVFMFSSSQLLTHDSSLEHGDTACLRQNKTFLTPMSNESGCSSLSLTPSTGSPISPCYSSRPETSSVSTPSETTPMLPLTSVPLRRRNGIAMASYSPRTPRRRVQNTRKRNLLQGSNNLINPPITPNPHFSTIQHGSLQLASYVTSDSPGLMEKLHQVSERLQEMLDKSLTVTKSREHSGSNSSENSINVFGDSPCYCFARKINRMRSPLPHDMNLESFTLSAVDESSLHKRRALKTSSWTHSD